MRKLVFFIIAMMALFNLIRAFATYNNQSVPSDTIQVIETVEEN